MIPAIIATANASVYTKGALNIFAAVEGLDAFSSLLQDLNKSIGNLDTSLTKAVNDLSGTFGIAQNISKSIIKSFDDSASILTKMDDLAIGIGSSFDDLAKLRVSIDHTRPIDGLNFDQLLSGIEKLRTSERQAFSGTAVGYAASTEFKELSTETNNTIRLFERLLISKIDNEKLEEITGLKADQINNLRGIHIQGRIRSVSNNHPLLNRASDVKNAKSFKRSITELNQKWTEFNHKVISDLMPSIARFIQELSMLVEKIGSNDKIWDGLENIINAMSGFIGFIRENALKKLEEIKIDQFAILAISAWFSQLVTDIDNLIEVITTKNVSLEDFNKKFESMIEKIEAGNKSMLEKNMNFFNALSSSEYEKFLDQMIDFFRFTNNDYTSNGFENIYGVTPDKVPILPNFPTPQRFSPAEDAPTSENNQPSINSKRLQIFPPNKESSSHTPLIDQVTISKPIQVEVVNQPDPQYRFNINTRVDSNGKNTTEVSDDEGPIFYNQSFGSNSTYAF